MGQSSRATRGASGRYFGDLAELERLLDQVARIAGRQKIPVRAIELYFDRAVHIEAGKTESLQAGSHPNAAAVSILLTTHRKRSGTALVSTRRPLSELCEEHDALARVLRAWNKKHPDRNTIRRSQLNALWKSVGNDIPSTALEKAGEVIGAWHVDRVDGVVALTKSGAQRREKAA